MKSKEGYEIYTKTISMKDLKIFKKEAKKIGALDKNGKIDFYNFLKKEDKNE